MIIMDVKLDNLYGFKQFNVNFSHTHKNTGAYIKNEHLLGKPNFRYKKVNIIMGASATGKTTLGMALKDIFEFIEKKTFSCIIDAIGNPKRDASFEIEVISESNELYRVSGTFMPIKNGRDGYSTKLLVDSVPIESRDSYETCKKRLDKYAKRKCEHVLYELEKLESLQVNLKREKGGKGVISFPSDDKFFSNILDKILTSLDPAILRVRKSKTMSDVFEIRLKDRVIRLKNGETSDVLSSGMRTGVEVAKVIAELLQGKETLFYCDEDFSSVHSELEKVILGAIVDSIQPNGQLFFTTNNSELLEMNLPGHSYIFLKKDIYNKECYTKCFSSTDFLRRSTDSLKTVVEKELFSVATITNEIYRINSIM